MTAPTPAAAVTFAGVTKDYVTDWRGRTWRALDQVSFVVPVGSICAVVGPNGSGKSTVLKLAAGLTRASVGHCLANGRAPAAALTEGQIGYLAEDFVAPPFFTGRDLLVRLARVAGLNSPQASEVAARLLATVGLQEAGDRRVGEYSKGLRQRLGLAQALIDDPQLLLLDEPAAGLDPRAVENLAGIIRAQRDAGRTVVLTSHFLPQVEELSDHFVLLERGRVLFTGSPAEVRQRGGLAQLYLEAVTR